MRHQQSGFTLIEIAIVLVIIGLLLGGVLKGQELITQAKIKNVINDFNGVATAIYAYQDRYKALPGDDVGAISRWSITGTTGPFGAGTLLTAEKTGLFWRELRLAGFIAGDTSSTAGILPPTNAAGGTVTAQWVTGTNLLGFSTPGLAICSDNLPAKIAESVDLQLDDGAANNGAVRASASSTLTTAATSYVDTSAAALYTACKAL
jgi:prepilin-type N-terminal cleavage/methylation domain-containing protein